MPLDVTTGPIDMPRENYHLSLKKLRKKSTAFLGAGSIIRRKKKNLQQGGYGEGGGSKRCFPHINSVAGSSFFGKERTDLPSTKAE